MKILWWLIPYLILTILVMYIKVKTELSGEKIVKKKKKKSHAKQYIITHKIYKNRG